MSNIKNRTRRVRRKTKKELKKVRRIKKTRKGLRKIRIKKKTRRGGSTSGKGIVDGTFSNAWASFPPSLGTVSRPVISGPSSFIPTPSKTVIRARNPVLDIFSKYQNIDNTAKDTNVQSNSIFTNSEIKGPIPGTGRNSARGIRRSSDVLAAKRGYGTNAGRTRLWPFIKSKFTTSKSTPSKETPIKTPVKETPIKTPVKETPIKTPVKETPKAPAPKPKAPAPKPKAPAPQPKK